MKITSETQVRDIAIERPAAVRIFESLGINYCCGGKHTLAEACAKLNLEVAHVLEELERQEPAVPEAQWKQAPLKDLAAYIVQKHHAFTRTQIDLVNKLAEKVERRHGADHPEIFQISKTFAVVSAELTHHFHCEENVLFPYISQYEADQQTTLPPVFGSVQQPIARMLADHDQADDEFRQLRGLTSNYTPPAAACPTWRAYYQAIEDLETDLREHIHLENSILFPRALEQAAQTA